MRWCTTYSSVWQRLAREFGARCTASHVLELGTRRICKVAMKLLAQLADERGLQFTGQRDEKIFGGSSFHVAQAVNLSTPNSFTLTLSPARALRPGGPRRRPWRGLRQPISSFAFAMRSMTHPRRSPSASEFRGALEAAKTAYLSFGYASSVKMLRRPLDTHLVRERLAGCALRDLCATSLRTCDFAEPSRERRTNSERHPTEPRRSRGLSG